jgi:hypothetical protein
MNPKFRFFYLLGGTIGLVFLIYQAIITYPDINPASVLMITIPDMVFFFLAYKTYPIETPAER